MSAFVLAITGFVPLVCRVNSAGELLCNAPQGYVLAAQAADAEPRVLEVSSRPDAKRVTYALRDGERYVVAPR